MRNFISSLLKKHEHGLVHTAFMTDAADRMIAWGINTEDLAVIRSSFDFLKNEIEENSVKEESYFFPIFSGAMDKTKIDKMKREHKLLKTNLSRIKEILEAINSDPAIEYIFKLKDSTKEFSKLLREHFIEEKDFLFMIAWKNLPENEIRNIFKKGTI